MTAGADRRYRDGRHHILKSSIGIAGGRRNRMKLLSETGEPLDVIEASNPTARAAGKSGATGRPDPLRRLTPTPLAADLPLMGRLVRLETNHTEAFIRARRLFARYPALLRGRPEFRWKIICEPGSQLDTSWPEISAFSDHGVRFVNIGQRSFIAVHLDAREAVAYLAEGLLQDAAGFVSPFLYNLFSLTAGALRLSALTAACVTKGEKGLLVFGMPNNGKTTSSYLATRLGLDFYADRAVFLDRSRGSLRVWGDFSPAAFRVQTEEFLPELRFLGLPFRYRDQCFLYVDEGTSIECNGYPVVPVACAYLERGATRSPSLSPLSRMESRQRLEQNIPFKDDERFAAQESAALSELARVPAYHLAYGNDPAEAAAFFPGLLANGDGEW